MDAKRYVYIVEDHPIIRDGYRQLLAEEPDLEACGMGVSIDEALREIPKRRVDVVLVDIRLGEDHRDGIDLLRALKARAPDVPVLVASGMDGAYHVRRALDAGADGFLSKRRLADELVEALRCVLTGELYRHDGTSCASECT